MADIRHCDPDGTAGRTDLVALLIAAGTATVAAAVPLAQSTQPGDAPDVYRGAVPTLPDGDYGVEVRGGNGAGVVEGSGELLWRGGDEYQITSGASPVLNVVSETSVLDIESCLTP